MRQLSIADQQQITDQIRQHRYRIQKEAATPGHFYARNEAQNWTAMFTPEGALLHSHDDGWEWGLRLSGYGYGSALQSVVGTPVPQIDGNSINYPWVPGLRETYRNGPEGVEQLFVLESRPRGANSRAPLRLNLSVLGNLAVRVTSPTDAAFTNSSSATALTYTGLKVYDAQGRSVPARFEADDRHLAILVDDAAATYPLTIDPLAQQAYIKAAPPGAGDRLGMSVAIDGDTMVVGAPEEDGVWGSMEQKTGLSRRSFQK